MNVATHRFLADVSIVENITQIHSYNHNHPHLRKINSFSSLSLPISEYCKKDFMVCLSICIVACVYMLIVWFHSIIVFTILTIICLYYWNKFIFNRSYSKRCFSLDVCSVKPKRLAERIGSAFISNDGFH